MERLLISSKFICSTLTRIDKRRFLWIEQRDILHSVEYSAILNPLSSFNRSRYYKNRQISCLSYRVLSAYDVFQPLTRDDFVTRDAG